MKLFILMMLIIIFYGISSENATLFVNRTQTTDFISTELMMDETKKQGWECRCWISTNEVLIFWNGCGWLKEFFHLGGTRMPVWGSKLAENAPDIKRRNDAKIDDRHGGHSSVTCWWIENIRQLTTRYVWFFTHTY
jgi:hypothetical protein